MSGWIKLHRKLRDNPIYNESKAVHCWIECLLRANHAGKEVYFKRNKIKLEPGMFLMGRQEFGKSIGISGSTAWYWLLRFEKDKMVDIKKTAKGSIVTIIAWNEYQQVDNRKTTEKQQKNTNKNVKNDKNIKRKTIKKKNLSDFAYKIADEFHDYQMKNCPVASIKNWDREKWVDVIDKLMRIDGYKQQTISDALSFAVNDDFWKKQIISLAGLRKKGKNGLTKFDNLVIRMERNR
jgi:hypothetical protein